MKEVTYTWNLTVSTFSTITLQYSLDGIFWVDVLTLNSPINTTEAIVQVPVEATHYRITGVNQEQLCGAIISNNIHTIVPPPPPCENTDFSTGLTPFNQLLTGVSNPPILINVPVCIPNGYINLIPGDTIPIVGSGFIAIHSSITDTDSTTYRIFEIDAVGLILNIFSSSGTPL